MSTTSDTDALAARASAIFKKVTGEKTRTLCTLLETHLQCTLIPSVLRTLKHLGLTENDGALVESNLAALSTEYNDEVQDGIDFNTLDSVDHIVFLETMLKQLVKTSIPVKSLTPDVISKLPEEWANGQVKMSQVLEACGVGQAPRKAKRQRLSDQLAEQQSSQLVPRVAAQPGNGTSFDDPLDIDADFGTVQKSIEEMVVWPFVQGSSILTIKGDGICKFRNNEYNYKDWNTGKQCSAIEPLQWMYNKAKKAPTFDDWSLTIGKTMLVNVGMAQKMQATVKHAGVFVMRFAESQIDPQFSSAFYAHLPVLGKAETADILRFVHYCRSGEIQSPIASDSSTCVMNLF